MYLYLSIVPVLSSKVSVMFWMQASYGLVIVILCVIMYVILSTWLTSFVLGFSTIFINQSYANVAALFYRHREVFLRQMLTFELN